MMLKGQTALITGSARGLGLLVAERLAAEGMNIAGVDVRGPELEKAHGPNRQAAFGEDARCGDRSRKREGRRRNCANNRSRTGKN